MSRAPEKVHDDLRNLVDGELEAVVLGTVLQFGEPAFREVQFLTKDDFAIEKHRLIFGVISALAQEANPTIDAVAERLTETGRLDAIGGLGGLVDIDERAIPGIRLAGFARSLRRRATDRRAHRLKEKLAKALDLGFSSNSTEVHAVIEEFRGLQYDLASDLLARTFG